MTIQLLVRYRDSADERPRVGLLRDGRLFALADVGSSMSALLTRPLDDLRVACEQATPVESTGWASQVGAAGVQLLAPVDGYTEVWAAGVTYRRSVQARVLESEHTPDVYDRVYHAERPELFFKSAAWRVVASGQPVAIRTDSAINVPEPELAVVINAHGQVVGYTVANDMSSRSIEGENPLYLPQAKVYLGGCALGPGIRPVWEVADPYALRIRMTIDRDGANVWSGEAGTEELQRRIDELASYLWHDEEFPYGVVLCTGTCLVPDLPFTLEPGDRVRIDISGIGTLENPVVRGKAAMSWLTADGHG